MEFKKISLNEKLWLLHSALLASHSLSLESIALLTALAYSNYLGMNGGSAAPLSPPWCAGTYFPHDSRRPTQDSPGTTCTHIRVQFSETTNYARS